MVDRGLYTWAPDHDGVLLILDSCRDRQAGRGSNLDARDRPRPSRAHAVEFSKTVAPSVSGGSRRRTRGRRLRRPPGEQRTIARRRRSLSAARAHETLETALADAQHAAVKRLRRLIDLGDRGLIERDSALLDEAPGLRTRHPEQLRDQRRQVHDAVVGCEGGLLDLTWPPSPALDAIPFLLLAAGRLLTVVDRGQLSGERPLGGQRIGPGLE